MRICGMGKGKGRGYFNNMLIIGEDKWNSIPDTIVPCLSLPSVVGCGVSLRIAKLFVDENWNENDNEEGGES